MATAAVFLQPLSEQEVTEALRRAESELTFLWAHHKVDRQAHAGLCNFGYTELDTFANIDSDKDQLRAFSGSRLELGAQSTTSRALHGIAHYQRLEVVPTSTRMELRRAYNKTH